MLIDRVNKRLGYSTGIAQGRDIALEVKSIDVQFWHIRLYKILWPGISG